MDGGLPRRAPPEAEDRLLRELAASQGSTSTLPDPARRAQGSTSTALVRETGEGGVGGERAPDQGEEGPAPPSCGRREWGRKLETSSLTKSLRYVFQE
jgi:hypothetical protein